MTTASRLYSDHIELRYSELAEPVVADLSFEVRDGAVTTIIGPNGCGKSTLLRALGRMLKPTNGAVVLDGQLIHQLPTKEVARRLGLLHQQTSAPEGITVDDLVRRGRYPHQGFLQPPTARDLEAVDVALALSGMTELRSRAVDSLSGGQRQRAWIAMALAQETDLLLLDEPTTYLDVAHQMEVMELVRALNAGGRTIVMVLHDMNEAMQASDWLVAMRAGRILEEGRPEDIARSDLLAELYGIQCDVFPHPTRGHPVVVPRSAPTSEAAASETARPTPADAVAGIEVRALDTGYQRRSPISRGLDFTLPAGRITSIVGPNACGKSTLLRTGARLLNPLGGSFRLGSRDTKRQSRRALARQLATVMQGLAPPPGFLVEDVVAAGRLSRQGFLRQWTVEDSQMVTGALHACGLEDLRYREIDTLSGGQRQRAWIAMALAQDAPVMFLDEPTTFLDVGFQIEVLDLVRELNASAGGTVVMVLHDLNLAARYSDMLVVMKAGEVIATGHPSEIITRELVREAFGIEAAVIPDPRTGRPLVLVERRAGAPAPLEIAPLREAVEVPA